MHNYTTLGHSKLYQPGHPLNFDEPLSWSQDAANGVRTPTSQAFHFRL